MTVGSPRADIGRRRAWWAIALSLLVHFMFAFFYVRGDPMRAVMHPRTAPTPREIVTIVERLKIEPKRIRIPAPERRRKRRPVPVAAPPRTVQIPIPKPLPLPRPASLPHPRPLPLPAHLRPRELAHFSPHQPPAQEPQSAPVTARQQFSGAQIARMENGFRSAIAHEGAGRDPLAVPPAPIDAPKHYGLDASSFTEGDRNHHGLCDPVKDWTADGYDYYYVSCNVRFSDGTYERQSVPWPVRFPPNDDPFAGTANGDKPLAMPLPGWHLSEGETVSVELRAYAKDHGIDL